jgi:hypothetical protein
MLESADLQKCEGITNGVQTQGPAILRLPII